MSDPLDRAASAPLPTVGEGCTARYDPDALTPSHGTDFPGAQALWREVSGEEPGAEEAPVQVMPGATP